jgi:hypothetical protein
MHLWFLLTTYKNNLVGTKSFALVKNNYTLLHRSSFRRNPVLKPGVTQPEIKCKSSQHTTMNWNIKNVVLQITSLHAQQIKIKLLSFFYEKGV